MNSHFQLYWYFTSFCLHFLHRSIHWRGTGEGAYNRTPRKYKIFKNAIKPLNRGPPILNLTTLAPLQNLPKPLQVFTWGLTTDVHPWQSCFSVVRGRLKVHVMPKFSETPLNTDEDVENWLKFYEMDAPFMNLSVFVSRDPVSVLKLTLNLEKLLIYWKGKIRLTV